MSLSHPKEGVDAGGDVLRGSRGQECVALVQVALQVVVDVAGQLGLAPHAIVAHGPIPGAQIQPVHQENQQQQGLVGWAPLGLHKQFIIHWPGHVQQGHT